MDKLLNKTQYAKLRGVTEAAVRKAINTGRITPESCGGIDPKKANVQWEKNTNSAKQRDVKVISSAAKAAQQKNYQSETQFQKAKTANEVLKAQIGNIELQLLKGEMIDRGEVTRSIFKMARAERDAWLNWPARISAQLAAEFEVDEQAFHVALDAQVRKHLIGIAGQPS